jgi:signal transduction histidine kinase
VRQGAIGLAVLLVVFAGVLWLVVGGAMRSVEAIRSRAAQITGQRLDQRVPEPQTRDEIHRLARTLNDMLERLEESARRQERFVGDAAHELRTPIATLRTRLETAMADEDAGRASGAGLLPELWEDVTRMGSLVDQLLLLARCDDENLAAGAYPVDLDDVVLEVVASSGSGRVVVSTVGVQPAQVVGEQALLEQVVRNLLENAVRHADRRVDVWLTSDGSSALLTVDDDGPGIAPERRNEVFHRFVRLDESRDRSRGGVGIGLALVAEIVRVHGGMVAVSDSPSRGARMQVVLPLLVPTAPGAPFAEQLRPVEPTGPGGW